MTKDRDPFVRYFVATEWAVFLLFLAWVVAYLVR